MGGGEERGGDEQHTRHADERWLAYTLVDIGMEHFAYRCDERLGGEGHVIREVGTIDI
jgi:hypothetical protein